ncbi:MAG: arginase [Actinobacteria bacterium]|nr:MAG: arginase [Actinomycetota bacterium]
MELHHDPRWTRANDWFKDGLKSADLALLGVGTHMSALTPNNSHMTPAAVRAALARYSTWSASQEIDFADHISGSDLGDVTDPDGPAGEERVIQKVSEALPGTRLLVALGGDNAMTFSAASGVAGAVGGFEHSGLVTLDAHHDVRDGISNGSPVRRLIEAGLRGEKVVQVGISDFANSKEYAARVRDFGITVIRRDEMRGRSMSDVMTEAFAVAGRGTKAIYVDIDVDVCDRSVAPACPAATPGGLSADELRQIAFECGRNAQVRAVDITEIDATLDSPDQRTIRLAALLVLELATGLSLRK